MGMKEGSRDEHQVMHRSVESLHWTPETNIALGVSSQELK